MTSLFPQARYARAHHLTSVQPGLTVSPMTGAADNSGIDPAWLKAELAEPGRSQSDLARFLVLHPVTVCRICSGERRIGLREGERIRQYLANTQPPSQADAIDPAWLKAELRKPGRSQSGLMRALGMKHPELVHRMCTGRRRITGSEGELIRRYLTDTDERRASASETRDLAELLAVWTKMAPRARRRALAMVKAVAREMTSTLDRGELPGGLADRDPKDGVTGDLPGIG
jgi:plasmid maintenance system antidote protein VapI